MVPEMSILGALLMLVDWIPLPEAPIGRRRPRVYTDWLFLKGSSTAWCRRAA